MSEETLGEGIVGYAEVIRRMDKAVQSMVPADLKEKGWIYKDLPGRLTPEAWNYFLDWIGEGEFQCICMSEGHDKRGEPWKRGQFFISPQGMINLADKERGDRLPTVTNGDG